MRELDDDLAAWRRAEVREIDTRERSGTDATQPGGDAVHLAAGAQTRRGGERRERGDDPREHGPDRGQAGDVRDGRRREEDRPDEIGEARRS